MVGLQDLVKAVDAADVNVGLVKTCLGDQGSQNTGQRDGVQISRLAQHAGGVQLGAGALLVGHTKNCAHRCPMG
jgi:aminopeptidase-like protein